ncbi:cysteine desulfurase family protein [Alkaliphilus serpentinus]|uniref:Cysteine desulfurase n=1 Tax=Alkaliphilus serpentinus TaxID=1482731 RepID=A0A833HN39_9FIRM|nr:cysteine desulfurase family protein [Alkaliphilus serpentinus]KAB3529084.1 cysteine desulfurase [Alkaliphilus serpentinus]
MEVYLDNAATTRVKPKVIQAVTMAMNEMYGNPSSLHKKGVEIERKIKEARKLISRSLDCREEELFFTSGGTEGNNIIIRGYVEANQRRGKHLITTKIEHPSVLSTFEALEKKGYKVTYLDVDNNGFISLRELEDSLQEDTILVSIMHVNNEVGSIQPIEKISKIIKNKNKEVFFHVDGVQSFGKILFSLTDLAVDGFSISGHKIHGPKGIGCLYIKKGWKVTPIATGGSHELGIRPGTENTPGIMGMAEAVKLIFSDQQNYIRKIASLKEYFYQMLMANVEDIKINGGDPQGTSINILNVSFKGVKSEVLLHSLEEDGIYVSSGSACSSKKRGYSHVLMAMGLKDEYIDSAIRFSFSDFNTKEELDYGIEKIQKQVNYLRKIMKR